MSAPELDWDQNLTVVDPPLRNRRRYGRWGALTVGVVLALLITVLATRKPALDQQTQSPLLGHPAPAFAGTSVTSGAFSSLAALSGRWVFVNYFATWCVPCQREHPQFVTFAQRHQQGADVQLVMVIYNDSVDKVQAFFRAHGGDWPAVADHDGQLALNYGVSGVPETFLVDPGGVIVSKIVGGVTADGLDRLLQAAKALRA